MRCSLGFHKWGELEGSVRYIWQFRGRVYLKRVCVSCGLQKMEQGFEAFIVSEDPEWVDAVCEYELGKVDQP